MKVLQKNQILVPYLNANETLKIGLNLLGLRNCSETLFTQLLPGLNNVTLRIRYYSFYCWIINCYYQTCIKNHISPDKGDFNKYIRRAEYLLAVIEAARENRGGLPGINWAINHINDSENMIDLALNADIVGNNKTYWKNSGGALAQYYVASLLDMGLLGYVEVDNSMINISRSDNDLFISGELLAKAFENSVGKPQSEVFIDCIERGSISNEELSLLSNSFYMHQMDAKSKERELLIDLLLQKDYPGLEDCVTYYRHDSIKYFLIYCQTERENRSDLDFAEFMHDRCLLDNIPDDTQLGWYAYYLNDMWQFYLTQIFSYILEVLKTKLRITVAQLAKEIEQDITSIYRNKNTKEVIDSEILTFDNDTLESLSLAGKAFANLLKLVANNRKNHFEKIQDSGLMSSYNYFDFVDKIYNVQPIEEYVQKFIKEEIIYRHYALSFQKQQYTGIATQKFIIENDIITYYASYPATHTSPRIMSLKNFLYDLNLINDKWIITDEGINILSNLNHD